MQKEIINNYWGLNIQAVEKKYNGKYVGDIAIKGEKPLAVFYAENPNTNLGHSNYFGIGGKLISYEPIEYEYYITNAIGVLENEYPAIELPNGELLMSLYPHDYKTIKIDDVDYMIDGGGSGYHRFSPINANVVKVKVVGDKIVNV